MSNQIIFATKNEHKMIEIRQILADLPMKVVSMEEAGIDIDVIEDGLTFEENAIKKAREIAAQTGDIVLADDSGLEVDYMNKEPGIYSARFGGVDTSYRIKNQMIIDRLADAKLEERTARFVCVIAAALPNGEIKHVRGTVEGIIAHEEQGINGFGYDPIFYVPEMGCTTAELSSEAKNEISHRGRALRMMKDILKDYFEAK
jgi:XTP/dITP diphosphohydrolase